LNVNLATDGETMSDTRVGHAPTRRSIPARRWRHAYEAHRRLWLAVFVAMGVAVAGATWGIRGATQVSHSRAQIVSLQAELARLQERVTADERTAASARQQSRRVAARAGDVQQSLQRINWALQSVPSQAQVATVRNDVAAYAGCIPQLQREIDGLRLSWRIDPARPSSNSFKLFTAAPVSGSCAAALAGH
jgi:cell division protein FtsB